MTCGHSREILALFIEDDLTASQAERIRDQVNGCKECQQVCEQLQASQSLIKTRLKVPLQTPLNPEALAGMRKRVLSQIQDERRTLGWWIQIERSLVLSFRGRPYALAGLAVLLVISAVLLGQPRHGLPAAQFDGRSALLRPLGYRDWVSLGNQVYIDPAGYSAYTKTGTFPDGTVIVMERVRAEATKAPDPHGTLVASVKDSNRFEGGWGFFDFSEADQTLQSRALAATDGTCRPCHEAHAQTDHVFTQFYPAMRPERML
jgi:Cytochrome P460